MLSVFAECWGREGRPGKGGIPTDGSCGSSCKWLQTILEKARMMSWGSPGHRGAGGHPGHRGAVPSSHSPTALPGALLGPTCPLPVPNDESVTELTHVVAPLVLLLVVLHPQRLCRGLTALHIKQCLKLVSATKICLCSFL